MFFVWVHSLFLCFASVPSVDLLEGYIQGLGRQAQRGVPVVDVRAALFVGEARVFLNHLLKDRNGGRPRGFSSSDGSIGCSVSGGVFTPPPAAELLETNAASLEGSDGCAAAGPKDGRIPSLSIKPSGIEEDLGSFEIQSFLDLEMRRKFLLIPERSRSHVGDAVKFFKQHFSQSVFDLIFIKVYPVLLEQLTQADNTSWDGGCQDRAALLACLGGFERQLRGGNWQSVPVWFRNFVVLNYFLGCCQEHWGKGSFLNCSFPEKRDSFRVDDWMANCVSPKTLAFLENKKCAVLSAYASVLVSTSNKTRCLSEEQLGRVGFTNQFGIFVPKATHGDSFISFYSFLEKMPQWGSVPGFVHVLWTHADSNHAGVLNAQYTDYEVPLNTRGSSSFGCIFHLFSLGLSSVQKLEVEGYVRKIENLQRFLMGFADYTDSDGIKKEAQDFALEKEKVSFLNGKLDRLLLRGLVTRKESGVSVKHIWALSNAERKSLLLGREYWPAQVELRYAFRPLFVTEGGNKVVVCEVGGKREDV